MRFSAALMGLTIVILGAGCEDDEDFTVCSPLRKQRAHAGQLSQAGLFADMDTEALAEGFSLQTPIHPVDEQWPQRSGAGCPRG